MAEDMLSVLGESIRDPLPPLEEEKPEEEKKEGDEGEEKPLSMSELLKSPAVQQAAMTTIEQSATSIEGLEARRDQIFDEWSKTSVWKLVKRARLSSQLDELNTMIDQQTGQVEKASQLVLESERVARIADVVSRIPGATSADVVAAIAGAGAPTPHAVRTETETEAIAEREDAQLQRHEDRVAGYFQVHKGMTPDDAQKAAKRHLLEVEFAQLELALLGPEIKKQELANTMKEMEVRLRQMDVTELQIELEKMRLKALGTESSMFGGKPTADMKNALAARQGIITPPTADPILHSIHRSFMMDNERGKEFNERVSSRVTSMLGEDVVTFLGKGERVENIMSLGPGEGVELETIRIKPGEIQKLGDGDLAKGKEEFYKIVNAAMFEELGLNNIRNFTDFVAFAVAAGTLDAQNVEDFTVRFVAASSHLGEGRQFFFDQKAVKEWSGNWADLFSFNFLPVVGGDGEEAGNPLLFSSIVSTSAPGSGLMRLKQLGLQTGDVQLQGGVALMEQASDSLSQLITTDRSEVTKEAGRIFTVLFENESIGVTPAVEQWDEFMDGLDQMMAEDSTLASAVAGRTDPSAFISDKKTGKPGPVRMLHGMLLFVKHEQDIRESLDRNPALGLASQPVEARLIVEAISQLQDEIVENPELEFALRESHQALRQLHRLASDTNPIIADEAQAAIKLMEETAAGRRREKSGLFDVRLTTRP